MDEAKYAEGAAESAPTGTGRAAAEDRHVLSALRASEERYRAVFEQAGDSIVVIDAHTGEILEFNDRAHESLGYTREEFARLAIPDISASETTADVARRLVTIREKGQACFETLHRTKGGEVRQVQVVSRLLSLPGRSLLSSVWRDLTDLKRMENELGQSEARLKALLDYSPALISTKDRAGNLTMVCRRFEILDGPSPAEFVGRNVYDLFPHEVADALWKNDLAVFTTGEPVEAEETVRHRDGTDHTFLTVKFPVTDEAGEVVEVCSISTDITDRKRTQAERFELERRVDRSQRLESLGVLAGGIAHDFNNLLTGVLGHAGLALDRLPPSSPLHAHLEQIELAARRAAELCNQMLAYSGRGDFRAERIDLSALVQEMAKLLESVISKKARLELDLAEDLPPMVADPSRVRQVVMNLITNASEALEGRPGRVTVRTRAMVYDAEQLRVAFPGEDLAPGSYALLRISDTGCGMDAETVARAFEPFFTSKFTGRGLGLSAVQGIVRRLGGAIHLESEPGKGTIFLIAFPSKIASATPVLETPSAARAAAEPCSEVAGTILVVDDQDEVRLFAATALRSAHWNVLEATDGMEAIEVFAAHADEISVVLLDQTMPKMGGLETLVALQQVRPDVPVVVTSGYSEVEFAGRFAGFRTAGFLEKPFGPTELLLAIRRARALR